MKIIAAMAALLVLAACGNSEPKEPASPELSETIVATTAPVDPAEGLQDAVEAYSYNFLSGKGEAAYDQLTKKCKDSIGKADFLVIATVATDTYGDLPIESYGASVEGTVAKVTYRYSNPEINQTDEQWIKQNGEWKNDDC